MLSTFAFLRLLAQLVGEITHKLSVVMSGTYVIETYGLLMRCITGQDGSYLTELLLEMDKWSMELFVVPQTLTLSALII